jgi:hypothetical protein
MVKHLLQSLFSQCIVFLNGVSGSLSKDLCNYRAYLETLFTYGHDASQSHLTNAFCYPVEGDVSAKNPPAHAKNHGYQDLFKLPNKIEVEMYGRFHGELFNVARLLLPGVEFQIKLTKSKGDVFLMRSKVETGALRFLGDTLQVSHANRSPTIQLPRANFLEKVNVRHMMRIALKTPNFGASSKSVSTDNAVLGNLPKSLLFTMLRNADFTGSVDNNPYHFRHFGLKYL